MMNRSRLVLALASLALATQAMADTKPAAAPPAAPPAADQKMTMMPEAEIKWGDAPPILPKGAKFALLYGDPGKAGTMYVVRLKMPNGYKIPAHWHPADENATVLSGTFNVGMGDKLDEKAGKAMAAGSFFSLPAQMHHFAWAKGETVVEISGMAPFGMTYVNPADDPSKAAAPAAK
jgi:quercetin dioxygenase-like cupin family protein